MKRSTHAAAWVLLVVVAVVLWPQQWGGSMTYVVTHGTSMAPTWQAGDLAVLRDAADYEVGDVVAYRSAELGTTVMHRVLAERDGVFTFQGDNNDFVDPDEVTDEQMLGRLVLRVPKAGLALAWLLTPVNMLLVAGAVYLLMADRRPPSQPDVVAPARVAEVDVLDLSIPAQTCVADVCDEADLARLAEVSGRPVLRNRATGESFVHDGAMVYRHRVAVRQAPEVGSGRDWQYGVDAQVLALLPRPRRADATVDHGLDVRKLLRLG